MDSKTKTVAQPKQSSITKARELAKAITTEAKAKLAKDVKVAQTKSDAKAKKAQPNEPKLLSDYYEQKVVAAKGVDPQPSGFFGTVMALAAKPITLKELIAKAVAGSKFTTKKDVNFVARVRVRHALTRLGYLQLAK